MVVDDFKLQNNILLLLKHKIVVYFLKRFPEALKFNSNVLNWIKFIFEIKEKLILKLRIRYRYNLVLYLKVYSLTIPVLIFILNAILMSDHCLVS
jgi:hypothetical protein